jgi:predicted DCC family thiol-disulfide oxidoreductase YuxK
VDWIIRHDKKRLYRFGSLQGVTAHKVVPEYAEEAGLSTVVLVTGDGKYIRSTAIARVLKGLGGFWKFCSFMIMIWPRPIRDWGYKLVVKNRYRWAGKKDSCRLPKPEERDLFLP